MKTIFKLTLSILMICLTLTSVVGQDKLSLAYKTDVVNTLSKLMNDHYVHPEIAKKTEKHISDQLSSGHFDKFENIPDFAKAVTESVQSINHDKHMKVMVNPPYEAPDKSPERMIEEKLFQLNRFKVYNSGFHSVKVLEGNVGYLDLRGFAGLHTGKDMADSYMKLMSNTDAIIIDLSKNGGGDPATVQYLCSYFFKGGIHLNSLYFREGDRTMDFFTLEEVDGNKMEDIPLFLITGEKTFSGAEEFSYNMQTQKRATLIGQTTGGGANPGGTMPIDDKLSVFIPTGMAINPITKTNWEGVGVVPEIMVSQDLAFDKAYELAKEAAITNRKKVEEKYTKTYMSLFAELDKKTVKGSQKIILDKFKTCKAEGIIQEWEINMLGYEYLMERERADVALSIFKANIDLHPTSANAHDSYGEALMMSGSLQESLLSYQKAVELATAAESPDISLYEDNLQKIKDLIKEKK